MNDIALHHEVDAEDERCDEVQHLAQPQGCGGEEILHGRGGHALRVLGDGVDAEPVGHGQALQLRDQDRQALREIGGKPLQIVQHRRKAKQKKDGQDEEHRKDEAEDGDGPRGMPAADGYSHDLRDRGGKHHGEESADVHQPQHGAQPPGQSQAQQQHDGEDDVAANGARGALGRRG
jgi:hypothetical protein